MKNKTVNKILSILADIMLVVFGFLIANGAYQEYKRDKKK